MGVNHRSEAVRLLGYAAANHDAFSRRTEEGVVTIEHAAVEVAVVQAQATMALVHAVLALGPVA